MGAKTWMLVATNGNAKEILSARPALDRSATAALAQRLFPSEKLKPLEDVTLSDTCPPDEELVIGCFPNLTVAAAKEFGLDYPSQVDPSFLRPALGRSIYVHAMHSVVDWFAYAVWEGGQLRRALSLSPDSGILEDVGDRLPFEAPFWAGQHPVFDADEAAEDDATYPFPFHPLELGEAALGALFGYQLEGMPTELDPFDVPLMRFKRSRPWWRRW